MSKRKEAITQDQVNAVCNELRDNDKKIAITVIQSKLGGSFTTISRMLAVWEAENVAQGAPVIDMPEAVTQAMHKAVGDIWGTVSALAGESVERIQNEATEAIAKAKADLSEYAGEVERLESDIATFEDHLDSTRDDIAKRDTRITELMSQVLNLETRLDDRDKELERVRADGERQQALNKTQATEAAARVSRLENELRQVNSVTAEKEARLNAALEQVTQLQTENITLQAEQKAQASTLKQAQADNTKTEKDTAITTADNTALKTRLDDRDDELKRVRADYEGLQKELIVIAKAQAEATKVPKTKGKG